MRDRVPGWLVALIIALSPFVGIGAATLASHAWGLLPLWRWLPW